MPTAVTSSRWRVWLLPALLVAAGFGLRVAYYRGSYGHPDEPITLAVVKYMQQSGDWDTNWAKAAVPEEFHYGQYNFSSYLYAVFGFAQTVRLIPGLEHWSALFDGYWVARFFSVLLGTCVVAQTWWLARRLAGEFAALVAGLLVAVVPLLVQDSHYARPEAFVTVLTLLVVGLAVSAGGRWRRQVLLVAVAVGLLVACKVSMLLLAWLPLLPAFVQRGEQKTRARTVAEAAVIGAAGLALGFALGAPGAVWHPLIFWAGIKHLMVQYSGIQSLHSHMQGGPVADMIGRYFAATLGWAVLAAGLAGAVVLAWRRAWLHLVALAGPVVLTAGYFATRTVFFERNLSHVVPLWCVLAGVGLGAATRALDVLMPSVAKLARVALVLVLLVQPGQITARLVWVEFSGRSKAQREAYKLRLQQAYPNADWGQAMPVDDEPLRVLAQHFVGANRPVLLEVCDLQDEWSTHFGSHLQARFDAELVGDWPSTFADQPFSTLLTYLSPHCTYYFVRGPRVSQPIPRGDPVR